MRKPLCTATVFLGLVGGIAAVWFIRLPDYAMWWLEGEVGIPHKIPLVLWIFPHIIFPLVLGIGAPIGLWVAASAICSKMRAGRRGGAN